MWTGFIAFFSGLIFGVAGAVFLVLKWAVPRLERLYVFRPARDIFKTPETLGLPFDQCFIDTPDGCRLSAWHLCPDQAVGSVIYFHGNSGNLGYLNEILGVLFRHGLQVLAFDYRGYGWSTGLPSESGLYTDALSVVRYFKANFQRDHLPLVYWGRSLGGCVAAHAARQAAPNGLILETSFPSKISLLKHLPHLRLFKFFSKCKLATAEYLDGVGVPALVVHGDKDKTVPIEEGRLLFDQIGGPKEFFCVKGAGHVDIHMTDTPRYMQKIVHFVESVRPPPVN